MGLDTKNNSNTYCNFWYIFICFYFYKLAKNLNVYLREMKIIVKKLCKNFSKNKIVKSEHNFQDHKIKNERIIRRSLFLTFQKLV